MDNILEVRNITKRFTFEHGFFKKESGEVRALDNVSFSVREFDTFGIVGESGSGKTTLAKIITDLIVPTTGEVVFNKTKIKNFRKDVQIIFQNPYNSLNPKMRVCEAIAEPLLIHKIIDRKYLKDSVIDLLKMVGLGEEVLYRFPKQFSGGQRQRICIARALATRPRFVVLDEPISSLDLTIQAKLLDLFYRLKDRFKLTYIFISHNLSIIKNITNRLLVMRNGSVIEEGDTVDIFERPVMSYTKTLIESAK